MLINAAFIYALYYSDTQRTTQYVTYYSISVHNVGLCDFVHTPAQAIEQKYFLL